MSIVRQLRRLAKDFEVEASIKRREAHDLTTIAEAKYDAFIRIDMLADKIERKLKDDAAQGIEAATADETGTGSAVGESPVVEDHAPEPSTQTHTTKKKGE